MLELNVKNFLFCTSNFHCAARALISTHKQLLPCCQITVWHVYNHAFTPVDVITVSMCGIYVTQIIHRFMWGCLKSPQRSAEGLTPYVTMTKG